MNKYIPYPGEVWSEMGKTSNKHKIITSEVNPASDIFSFLIFKYFTTGRRYREYRKCAEKKLLFVMIHSNGSARPRPDNQVCSFHQYQYCTVTSSNVCTSSSLVTFDIWSLRRRESAGRRGGGGSCSTSFVRGLLGPSLVAVSRSQRRYEQRGEKALSAAAGRLQQARLWKYTLDIIEIFFACGDWVWRKCFEVGGPQAKPNPSQQGRKIWLLFFTGNS